MDKIIESIEIYNPNETNFKEWTNKNSKIPKKKFFESANIISRPINKKYHEIEEMIKKNFKI